MLPSSPKHCPGYGSEPCINTHRLESRLFCAKFEWEEVEQIVQVLEEISQPFIAAELAQIRRQGQRLCLDGDLTGLPVSNTSCTYPNAAYGHMNTEIRLGYQAALVSMESPTYGRLWLSVAYHPGDTVSCTQAEELVLAAERRTGLRPRRRTERLRQRIRDFEQAMAVTAARLEIQQKAVQQAGGGCHLSAYNSPRVFHPKWSPP